MADDLFSNLPTDIFFDILSRLPLTSISNCRWVNKTWLNLVRHPRLAEIHYARAINTRSSPSLLFTSDDNTSNLISGESFDNLTHLAIPYNVKFHEFGNIFTIKYQMIGSVNGLICYSHRNKYYICNPVTGESKVFPTPPSDTEPVAIGFGFDHSRNDYKVVRVLRQSSENGNKIEVYTLGSTTWRETETNVEYLITTSLCNVLLNGAIHWIAHKSYTSFSVVILAFHVASEEFSIFELPLILNRNVLGFRLLGGRLCVTVGAIFGEREIWVMKDYGDDGSWEKENINEYSHGAHQVIELRNGELLLLHDDLEIGYYHPQERRFNRIEVHNFGRRLVGMEIPVFLMGSLFSPKNLGYH